MAMSYIQSLLTSMSLQIFKITTGGTTTVVQQQQQQVDDDHYYYEPFDVIAVPGLTTLLDDTLYNTYEEQLTSTITSGSNLLHTWIAIQHQSIKIYNLLQKYYIIDEMNKINLYHENTIKTTTTTTTNGTRETTTGQQQQKQKHPMIINHHHDTTLATMTRYYTIEILVRICYDMACDAIQRITTDRFADTANLSLASSETTYDSFNNTTTTTTTNTSNNNNNNTNTKQNTNSNHNSSHSKGGGKNSNNNNNKNNSNKNNNNTNNINDKIGTAGIMSPTMVTALLESVNDTGRRSLGGSSSGVGKNINNTSSSSSSQYTTTTTTVFRATDCWESQRLCCPDYIWADDVVNHTQRLLRIVLKNQYVMSYSSMDNNNNNQSSSISSSSSNNMSGTTNLNSTQSNNYTTTSISDTCDTDDMFYNNNNNNNNNVHNRQPFITMRPVTNTIIEQELSLLLLVLTRDLPSRLVQFRTAIEADAMIMKRLYLVKLEYRAPFRTFLESHQSLQRAPSLLLVNEYLNYPKSKLEQHRTICKDNLQQLLTQPYLIEALALEKKCEEYELAMTETLYGFCELSRYILMKRACIIPPMEDDDDNITCNIVQLRETIRCLKTVLCCKAGPDSSIGIRPLLLDLQGVPRDEERYDKSITPSYFVTENDFNRRLDTFIHQLHTLRKLCCYTKRHCFFRTDRKVELEIPTSIVRGCDTFDDELFRCYCVDWFNMTQRQHEIVAQNHNFDEIAESIRKAEIQLSLAAATHQSLDVVRVRLEALERDREKRYQLMKEIVEDVCLREMNLRINITQPSMEKILALQPTSALGIFGLALQMVGETLPLG